MSNVLHQITFKSNTRFDVNLAHTFFAQKSSKLKVFQKILEAESKFRNNGTSLYEITCKYEIIRNSIVIVN